MSGETGALEGRVLICAPTGRDAALACSALRTAGIDCDSFVEVAALCQAAEAGAGALLLAEEVLSPAALRDLARLLAAQPPWSDLPVVILASPVKSTAATSRMRSLLEALGNVSVVERPTQVAALVLSLRSALRARNRQYMARKTLQELQAQSEATRQRADFEQQLIGIVSHDLRNPLQAILLSASALLRREDLDERATKTAARIGTAAERAVRMIRDLLDFTQARLGRGIRIAPSRCDLHGLLRTVVDEVEVAHPERTLVAEHQGDGQGEWDADRVAQALTNLLANAVSYGSPGTPVTARSIGEEDWVRVEIHNQGAAIPAEVRPRLFEPLERGQQQATSLSRSIGLGLFIVRQIVTAHGGTVHVRSSDEEGTTFVVRLPRRVEQR